MTTERTRLAGDWPASYERCVAFHGHNCPGLAIGYRAAVAALAALSEERAGDEELVAIVETDACGADALQVLTGCTFGKGNLLHRDHGKHVFTLLERRSGRGIRLALKAGATAPNERHRQLMDKLHRETATEGEIEEFWDLHGRKAREVLEKPIEALFDVQKSQWPLPSRARMEPSRPCARCGEPTMASKLIRLGGREVCRACIDGGS